MRRPGRALQADWTHWGFLLLAIAMVANCWQAEYPREAWLGLANFLPFFGFYLAIRRVLTTPARLYRLAQLWVGSAIAVALLGIGQVLAGWQTPPGWQYVFGWALQPTGNPPGRLASTFLYANTCAAFLGLAWILGLGAAIVAWRRWRRDRRCWRSLLGLGLGLGAIGTALVLASSRGAWAVAGLAVLVYASYLGWHWLLGLAGLAGGSVLWAAFGVPPSQQWLQRIVPTLIWARLNDSLYPNRPLAMRRTTQWQFCWDLVRERPWQGWGLRNFTPLYEAAYPGVWLGHPHNLFLMLAAEIGLPATLLLFVLVGWPLGRVALLLQRSPGGALAPDDRAIVLAYFLAFGGCMLLNLPDVTVFELRNNILGWLLLAALDGIARSPVREGVREGS